MSGCCELREPDPLSQNNTEIKEVGLGQIIKVVNPSHYGPNWVVHIGRRMNRQHRLVMIYPEPVYKLKDNIYKLAINVYIYIIYMDIMYRTELCF